MKNERGTGKSERERGEDAGALVLSDIIDVQAIQSMMDDFFGLTNIGVAVLDIKGKVLVATGWQDICTRFHRVHPETNRYCVESDTLLSKGVKPGTFKIYQCKNHMWDMATPIIVGGQHVGNLFLGQFLFADEQPDYAFFREQARKYGFDETEYLAALDRVPRWEKETVHRVMTFYSKFAQLISELSYANLRLARTVLERATLLDSLQKTEAQYRYLVQNSNDIIWAFDMPSQKFSFSSSAVERILGYPNDTKKKMTLDDVFSRETKKQVLAAFGKLATGAAEGDRVVVEAEHLHHNGGKVWMEISATVLKDGDGKPVGFTGVSRDITERKRTQALWQRNEEELRWLFKSMFNAFVLFESVFDADGRFISYRFVIINDAYERITGVKNEEVKGKTVHEVWPETEPEWIRRYGEVAVTGISQTFDLYHDPTKKVYHCNAYRPWDTQDRFCVIFEDITEKKRLEAERDALEAQTRQLQKAESLGRMAGAVAHHFNNQLQVVMGNLQLAMGELPQGAGLVECMTESMQAARRAAKVSGQMLTYLGQTQATRNTLDLSEICRVSLPMLQAAMPGNMVIETDLPSPGPAIRANTRQMEQILTNLVTNAWESMSEAGSAIYLSVKTVSAADIPPMGRFPIDWQPDADAYACIEVMDEGTGIPGQDVEKLFDPFFSTKFMGRGLGLSVVLGIVRAHGGGVTVESQGRAGSREQGAGSGEDRSQESGGGGQRREDGGQDSGVGGQQKEGLGVLVHPVAPEDGTGASLRENPVGAVFRVYLPLCAEEAPRRREREVTFAEIPGDGTVLVVEDTPDVRRLGVRMLELLGLKVLAAKDGVEGVEIFRKHRDEIRFVLCDLTMPRMDGWETLAALRKIRPDIPVILASGYDEASVMSGEHAERPNTFLAKPYCIEDLSKAIGKVIEPRMDTDNF